VAQLAGYRSSTIIGNADLKYQYKGPLARPF
jgi:hypothetical protein